MKTSCNILFGLAAGFALCFNAQAAESVHTAPYATIATRNMFGLEKIPIEPQVAAPAPQLPKVVPKGITTIFGQSEVVFTMEESITGGPSSASWHRLKEGQAINGVTVIQIDPATGTVTFDNHGVVQQLPLAADTVAGRATP